MGYNTLLVDESNGVITVRLNRPDVHNAFNDELIGEAIDLFTSIGSRNGGGAVVHGSGGPNFCAGADLKWMSKMVS